MGARFESDELTERRRIAGFVFAVGLVLTPHIGCVPAPSDNGGSIPPPVIDDRPPPVFNPNSNSNPPDAATLVFDVTIRATSLFLAGISIDGALSLTVNQGANAASVPFTAAVLRDNVNDPTSGVGLSGGVFLTAAAGVGISGDATFELGEADNDGTVTATFSRQQTGEDQNRFILAAGGLTFEPGVIGVSYAVQSGSTFTFRVDGDTVDGTLNLSGAPINEAGPTEVYTGTFSGRAR